jgi:hypothetical protein
MAFSTHVWAHLTLFNFRREAGYHPRSLPLTCTDIRIDFHFASEKTRLIPPSTMALKSKNNCEQYKKYDGDVSC